MVLSLGWFDWLTRSFDWLLDWQKRTQLILLWQLSIVTTFFPECGLVLFTSLYHWVKRNRKRILWTYLWRWPLNLLFQINDFGAVSCSLPASSCFLLPPPTSSCLLLPPAASSCLLGIAPHLLLQWKRNETQTLESSFGAAVLIFWVVRALLNVSRSLIININLMDCCLTNWLTDSAGLRCRPFVRRRPSAPISRRPRRHLEFHLLIASIDQSTCKQLPPIESVSIDSARRGRRIGLNALAFAKPAQSVEIDYDESCQSMLSGDCDLSLQILCLLCVFSLYTHWKEEKRVSRRLRDITMVTA